MVNQEDLEILEELITESREHLAAIEPDLLELERAGGRVPTELVNRVFRAIHSIKGGFGFFGVRPIETLTHVMESVLMKVRDGELAADPAMIDALLTGVDRVREMLDDLENADRVDAAPVVESLRRILDGGASPPGDGGPGTPEAGVDPDGQGTAEPSAPAAGPADPAREAEDAGAGPAGEGTAEPSAPAAGPADPAPEDGSTAPGSPGPGKGKAPAPAAGGPASPPSRDGVPAGGGAGGGGRKVHASETLRVKVELLDRLMNLAGELVLARNQMMQALGRRLGEVLGGEGTVKGLHDALGHAREQVARAAERGTLDDRSRAVLDGELEQIGALFDQVFSRRIHDMPGIGTSMGNVDTVTTELQENIMRTRMQTLGTVFGKFPRVIRELCRKTGKEIEVEIEGSEVELDKSIIEALGDPMTHLLRNAADHGIEPPEERERAGKPRTGRLRIAAFHEGGQVNILIEDDGRGIDVDRVKAKAVERGLITPAQAQAMDDREAVMLIFAPGFSTAEQVTDVSGRGVGMDVVRNNVESLGGQIEVESRPGQGTTVVLKLPLTLAIIPSLVVTAGGRRFAVPQVSLEELVRLRAGDPTRRLEQVHGAEVMRLRGRLLPIVRLREQLGMEEPAGDAADGAGRAVQVLVLKVGAHRYGLVVDEVLDSEEIVVKPLPVYLKDSRCYAGATIMGDGRVAMILDVAGIAEKAGLKFGETEGAPTAQEERKARLEQTETQSLLLFRNHPDQVFAINLGLVARIERISRDDIDRVGGVEYLRYPDRSLRLVRLHDFLPVNAPGEEPAALYVIVPKLVRHTMGILATDFEDVIRARVDVDQETLRGPGILGSAVVDGRMVIFLDIYGLFELAEPELFGGDAGTTELLSGKKVLLAEDTPFFREVVRRYLAGFGAEVDVANDGEEAWSRLRERSYDLLVTDIEMPGMNGYELTSRVRQDPELRNLPVIALTALGDNRAARKRGEEAGVDGWETKLDREALGRAIRDVLSGRMTHA